MGSRTPRRAWLAAALTVLILYGAAYVPPVAGIGPVIVATRAVSLLYKFVTYARTIDYWKLLTNTIAFLSTSYDLVNLYQHLTEVEETVHTEEDFHQHLETCKVCNELFCAMVENSDPGGQIPPFAPPSNRSPTGSIRNGGPQAAFEHIWSEHNALENGRKGLRIHLRFRVENAREVACRVIAYFSLATGEPLADLDGSYFSARGQVAVGRDFRPAYQSALYRNLTLFMPYDELHMAPGRHDLAFQIGLFDKISGQFLDRSTGYAFSIRK